MSPIPTARAASTGVDSGRINGGTSGSTMKDSSADIGTHLRAARMERGLSLREMARRIGVSPSFVSQVELGKAKPSLGTLYGFLSELDLSLDELMPSAAGVEGHSIAATRPKPALLASSEGPLATSSFPDMWMPMGSTAQPWTDHPLVQMKGVTWRRLTADDPLVDFLHATYEPGSESCPLEHLMRHEGHEYGHIISGRLRVQVAFETFDLGAGDSINFPSTTPHRLANEGTETCTSIWVVVGRRSTSRALHVDPHGIPSQIP
jgi:transcriptional regulator with XRE-family HTH domain/mannose-6-phosphate isomerase-like protein (cupin superfamily)